MVCHRVQPGTPAISYKLITTKESGLGYLIPDLRGLFMG